MHGYVGKADTVFDSNGSADKNAVVWRLSVADDAAVGPRAEQVLVGYRYPNVLAGNALCVWFEDIRPGKRKERLDRFVVDGQQRAVALLFIFGNGHAQAGGNRVDGLYLHRFAGLRVECEDGHVGGKVACRQLMWYC